MTTLRYELLIRDAEKRKRIRLLGLFSRVFSIIFYVSAVMPAILGQKYMFLYYSFLLVAVCYLGYSLFFTLLLSKYRKEQTFENFTDGVEFHQAALNFKFNEFSKRRKKLFLFCGLVLVAFILLVLIFLTLLPKAGETVAAISGILIVADIFIAVIVDSIRQTKFAQAQLDHISFLQKHFSQVDNLSYKQKKVSAFKSVADGQKLTAYMYPDEQIRTNINKSSVKIVFYAVIIGIAAGVSTPLLVINKWFTGLVCVFGGCIAAIGFLTFLQVKWIKKQMDKQMEIFKTDPQKYIHYIEHQELTREYQKNSNKISLLISASIAIIGVTLAIVFILKSETEAAIGILSLAFLVWLVSLLIVTFAVSYPKYRRKARKIEEQIDAQLSEKIVEIENPFEEI